MIRRMIDAPEYPQVSLEPIPPNYFNNYANYGVNSTNGTAILGNWQLHTINYR